MSEANDPRTGEANDPISGDITDAATAALLDLALEVGWRRIEMRDIAERAGLDEAALYRTFADKAAILNAYTRAVDLAACEEYAMPQERLRGDEAYDRLLDILMRRFEVMERDRAAIRVLADTLPRDPGAILEILPQMRVSMARMAEAAGLPVHGIRGMVAVKALAAVWFSVQRVWFTDESEDLSRTMAALDRTLRRAWPVLRGRPMLPGRDFFARGPFARGPFGRGPFGPEDGLGRPEGPAYPEYPGEPDDGALRH